MTSERPDSPGPLATAKRLLRLIVAVVNNRIELLAVELREEGSRLVGALVLAAAVVVFCLLTLVMLTFTIVLAAGEEHRLAAAIGTTVVYLAAALASSWRLRVKLKNWSPFSATLNELRKDRAWLEGKETET